MVIPNECSKAGRNPYQRRQRWRRRRADHCAPTFHLIIAGFCLTIVGIVTVALIIPRSSLGCTEIQSLLDSARLEHVLRQRQQQTSNSTIHNRKGGVVIFWHLAKVGGSTIRGNFASFSEKVDYRPLLKASDWNRIVPQIEKRLSTPNNASTRILFVELHGQGTFPNQQWDTTLQSWRDLAMKHDKNLFVFTILREPTSHAISYYNYFHKSIKSILDSTISIESDFKKTFMANRQCTTLAQSHSPKGLFSFRQEGTSNPYTCANVYAKLLQYFDWIGTTETLSTETLPLVHALLSKWTARTNNSSTPTFARYNVGKPENERLRLSKISNSTRDFLQQYTCLDQALWQQVQQDYSIHQVREKCRLS